jgi:phosphoribosylanthranilate isomerase
MNDPRELTASSRAPRTAEVATRPTTVVKICGIRRYEDALGAATAGADVIGVNFWPGTKRYLAAEEAAAMLAAARAAHEALPLVCGLFVNADRDTIREAVERCELDLVQLAGDETPDDLASLGVPVIKTVRPLPDEDTEMFATRLHVFMEAARSLPPGPFGPSLLFLLDANVPGHYGGTGETSDWSLAAALRGLRADGSHETPDRTPLDFLLAGGLTPENIGAAVRAVRPWGVDVASGVELPGQPGIKDRDRMRAFVHAVRAAEAEHAGA